MVLTARNAEMVAACLMCLLCAIHLRACDLQYKQQGKNSFNLGKNDVYGYIALIAKYCGIYFFM